MKYYSQHGEDFILNKLFNNKANGFFVEIGCIDGKRFSNTLFFEEKGWTGIGVEAHNDYISLMKKNRPNSITVHAAVSDKNEGQITFYANSRGTLSSIDLSREEEFKTQYGEYFTGYEEQKVPMRTLTSIFDENNVKEIDFISLDIEGHEYSAVCGLDLNKYKPKVWIIECDEEEDEKNIYAILKNHGYRKSIKIRNNRFFILHEIDDSSIKNQEFKVNLTNTEHPLDNDGDQSVDFTINTKSKNLLNKLFQFFK